MAASPYKLSCTLYGHTLDVRSVVSTKEGNIVSGSRDKSAKIWIPNGINAGYSETQTLVGHTNFVSTVCVLPPCPKHPSGVVLTGSNDHTIRAFELGSPIPLCVLKGHTSAVCKLAAGICDDTALSASWDATARMWNLDGLGESVFSLSGHQAAVWSVIQLPSGCIVTGSADKTIKLWSEKGVFLSTLTGHTDCVRDLVAILKNEFLSCANDAVIKHWNATTGACLGTFYGHSNYIYSIAVFPGAGLDCFVSCGEDRTVRLWQGGECQQTITLPAESVWTVAFLPNGDIVTGSSDGLLRVFTTELSRQAEPAVLQRFEEEVASMNKSAEQEIGGVKISELPGKEALYEPGRKDGQTKLVREDANKVGCYKWSVAQCKWERIGDVTGASGGSQSSSGKQLYNGKEYDYVFSVDIEDGKPPLKLPYNADEDPWFAAQKFIHDNNLSQLFLDQVANFIITNSKAGVSFNAPSGEFADPFTGGNRYIPVNTAGDGINAVSSNTDPFTGASRYMPSNANQPHTNGLMQSATGAHGKAQTVSSDSCPTKPYFPQKTYLRFDQANLKAILEKLLEFNQKTGDGMHKIEESHLEGVVKLAEENAVVNSLCIEILKQLLEWPQDIIFPVLDVTRLAVRNEAINKEFCSGQTGDQLIGLLRRFLRPDSTSVNQMLSLRIICNMLTHPDGEKLALKHKEYLLSVILDLNPPFNKQLQVAIATLLLNFAVAFNKTCDSEGWISASSVITTVLPKLSDAEAVFRCLVALGTVIWEAESIQADLISLIQSSQELKILLEKWVVSEKTANEKVNNCAAQILALINV